MKFAFAFVVGTLLSVSAQAEPKTCQQVYNLGMEMGCSFSKADQNATTAESNSTTTIKKEDDFLVESEFGPTACKTSDLAKELVKDLKGECQVWVKERKADLGTKYQTGTCSEKCSDCTMGLKRCSVAGVVHYAK
jgi:hypothetical protein